MKKRGPKAKVFGPEVRAFAVAALRRGYSINSVSRAADVGETHVIRWRNEAGIPVVLHTNSKRQNLPSLEFFP